MREFLSLFLLVCYGVISALALPQTAKTHPRSMLQRNNLKRPLKDCCEAAVIVNRNDGTLQKSSVATLRETLQSFVESIESCEPGRRSPYLPQSRTGTLSLS